MTTGRILAIASNPDLGKSLAFALEAEDFDVTVLSAIPAAAEARVYDCVVLDHRAAKVGTPEAVLEFCAAARKVVLLAGSPQPWLAAVASAVIATPHLGEPLIAAVRAAVGEGTLPAS